MAIAQLHISTEQQRGVCSHKYVQVKQKGSQVQIGIRKVPFSKNPMKFHMLLNGSEIVFKKSNYKLKAFDIRRGRKADYKK